MEALLPKEDPPSELQTLEFFFLFCALWSCGAVIHEDDFDKFEDFFRKLNTRGIH